MVLATKSIAYKEVIFKDSGFIKGKIKKLITS